MAYINLNKYQLNGFITKKGREFFFKNGFNVSQFGLGDSDINYLTLLNNGQGTNGNAETILTPPLTYSGGSGNFITIPNIGGVYSGSCKINTAMVEIKHHISVGDCVELVDELIIGEPKIYFEYTNITANNDLRSLDLEIIYSNLPTDVKFRIVEIQNENLIFSYPNGNEFIVPRGTGRIILPINNSISDIVRISGRLSTNQYSVEPKFNFIILTPLNLAQGNLILPKRKIPNIVNNISIIGIDEPITTIPATPTFYTNNYRIINNFTKTIELLNVYINNNLIDIRSFTNQLPLIPGTQTAFNASLFQSKIPYTNGITNIRLVFRGRQTNLNVRSIDIYNDNNNTLIASYNINAGVVDYTTPGFIIGANENLRIILRDSQ